MAKKVDISKNPDAITDYFGEVTDAVRQLQQNAYEVSKYRSEASRLASIANKRVSRLKKKGLTDSPAYQRYIKDGVKFGVKGKSHNELQSEVSRLVKFLDADTSTIRGYNKTLRNMAADTGIKYTDIKQLRAMAPKFFELSSKVEQYLRTVEDSASAIGYQKIWQAVNEYIKENRVDLGSAEKNIDEMTHKISQALSSYESDVSLPSGDFISLTDFPKTK